MDKVLVTGITGNVGSEVARNLMGKSVELAGAVYDEADSMRLKQMFGDRVSPVILDFVRQETHAPALVGISKVFLMRPPAIADVKRFIFPFIDACKKSGVEQIAFLSLMGIERNPIPPHYKVEKYIEASGIPYTFLRPSFFMQNLNTTHKDDIKHHDDLFIPCGRAKTSFIDTRDIGEVGAKVLLEKAHLNKGYTLTGPEALDYNQVAAIFTRVLGRKITYSNPSLLMFRRVMIERGIKPEFANVMVGLYLTTRFGAANRVTDELEELLGRRPTTVEQYVQDYTAVWVPK